jgi:hypothetical protein
MGNLNAMISGLIAKTITNSGWSSPENIYDGSYATAATAHTQVYGGASQLTTSIKVDFTTPIDITEIVMKSMVASGSNGVESGSISATATLKINGTTVWTKTASTISEDKTYSVPQGNVSSVELILYSYASGGGNWWSEANNSFTELEVYVGGGGHGFIL